MNHFSLFFNCLFSYINKVPTAPPSAAASSVLPPHAPISQEVKEESAAHPDSCHSPDEESNLKCSMKTRLEYI